MNYYPSFRVRSWNNGMHCMSPYILTHIYSDGTTRSNSVCMILHHTHAPLFWVGVDHVVKRPSDDSIFLMNFPLCDDVLRIQTERRYNVTACYQTRPSNQHIKTRGNSNLLNRSLYIYTVCDKYQKFPVACDLTVKITECLLMDCTTAVKPGVQFRNTHSWVSLSNRTHRVFSP